MEKMEKLRESVLSSFEDGDLSRVDEYIRSIRDSLKSTNSRFVSLEFLLLVTILSYHFYVNGQSIEILAFGLKIRDVELIKKWFLIVPSLVFLISTSIGYLRVYQQETIEWLTVKYRPKEFKSGIYRLTFPSNYILGLDILRRQKGRTAKPIAILTGLLLFSGSTFAPIWYIYWAYKKAFLELGPDYGLIISASISGILLLNGLGIIVESQKI
jgi:hypothetical protein